MRKQLFATLGIVVLVCAALFTARNAPTHVHAATAVTPVVGMARTSDKSGRDVLEDLQDAAAGKVATAGHPLSATLLHLIVVLGQNHSLQITALESGGTGHATNSYHYTGDAVDIDQLDSQPVTGRNTPSLTIINALISLMPNGSAFGQRNCGTTPPLPAGITTFPDSCNHLHIQVPRTSP